MCHSRGYREFRGLTVSCDKCDLFRRPEDECLFCGAVSGCVHMGEVAESV